MEEILRTSARVQADTAGAASTVDGVAPSNIRTWQTKVRALLKIGASEHASVMDERLLAGTRMGAALVLLVATFVDDHARQNTLVLTLILLYVVHAAGALVHNLTRPEWFVSRSNLLQWIDLLWTIAATSASGGLGSYVFPYFAFVLAAAAVRWGLQRSLHDGGIVLATSLIQAAVLQTGYTPWRFEWDVFVVRVSFVVVGAGVVFGVLTERLHALRFQATALSGLVTDIGAAARLKPAVELTMRRILELFDARLAWLVVEEADTAAVHLWYAARTSGPGIEVFWRQLTRESHHHWRQPVPCDAVACELRRAGSAWRAVSLPPKPGGRLVPHDCSLPPGIIESEPCRTILSTSVEFARVFRGKLYVCDPVARPRGELRLRFLRRISQQAAPALLNLYLLRNLRSHAESLERARIARELHDGVLQSLAGIEMRLDVLRRQAENAAPDVASQLAEVRDLLHEQALEARELMLRLRPLEVDADRLHAALRDMAERFSRSVNITTRFDWAVDRLNLSPRECNEVVRVLQEALVNVRRHSGATRVDIRVEADADTWALSIRDNGHGLGFNGRWTHEELDAQNGGPHVIRERVEALRGRLAVESSAAGARLEMTFPRNQPG